MNNNQVLVPLVQSPLLQPDEDKDCLDPVGDCISKRFIGCVNSNKGACCLTTSLLCAVGGVSTSATGLIHGNTVLAGVGMAMQSCGIAFTSAFYGAGCGQSETLRECRDRMQQLHQGHMRRYQALNAQHQQLVLQQPQPQPPIAPDDGYNSGVDE